MRIEFDEIASSNGNTIELYFSAPKEILGEYFPNKSYSSAVSAEILIEIDGDDVINTYLSPSRLLDGSLEEYDWQEVYFNKKLVNRLVTLAKSDDAMYGLENVSIDV
ncbi:hypothetical protein [Eubacterium oxidoreducens]|uniref:Uncharacterized protein n=1 Tax=Eubacterium oxidoreducens TaxID=1732 RepID=A0A1G6B2P9_EUBOX|nr:hypothetical protein [Eubacterium oxidoreducens]SDB14950.1 hypothetical protein SAMN02910417_01095 [Eubacterium oxidoreducens]